MNQALQENDVELAQSGDREAFTRLIKAHEATLYRIACSILHVDSDRLDAAQETIVKAYLSLHKLREPQYFKSWLISIAINECRRLAKRNAKITTLGTWTQKASPETFEDSIELREAIETLEEELRICITLHYIEDLPVKEIAGILRQPEGTIKSRLSRARRKLKQFLTPEETGLEAQS